MSIKLPIQVVGKVRPALLLLPLYYVPVLPLGLLLNALDVRRKNEAGTGLLVIAEKPPSRKSS